ncbi:MAG TPA: FAD-dependent monooxygenase [Actinomycetota bacterium]|nr:FAD-dependent monooxygenase [Actinomycetota bacterium]
MKPIRVVVLGGGPAGLYASLLLKRVSPKADVTVLERNPAGATYGWGVVFSDRTLTEFREADQPTYEAITDRFVLWDAIDIHYRDELIRSGGHVFAGIARVALLGILARRAEELGVELRFETEVEDVAGLDADLVVGADGVNSLVRGAHEDVFRPRLTSGRSRYVWYGTDRVLDSFTFIFRENDHGLFQVHAYPFDGTRSTWVVECDEETWRRAGLDAAGEEESIAYCEKLFADDLRGHSLFSNRSQWINFVTVRSRTWRHGNVVLLGDAAHTAHFSIGSGTKLAMEDAISLARGFERHGDDLPAALADYELERKPVVERFQEAADESRSWFERTRRYVHLEPMRFAFYLFTRSGRIDYDNLRLRDPAYVDRVDRWFAGRDVAPPPIHTPLRLRDLVLRNRVAARPGGEEDGGNGFPGPSLEDGVSRAADGGAALVLTGPVAVSAEGRITPASPGLYRAEHPAAWRDIVERAHASGAAVAVPLGHAGRRGSTRPRGHGIDRPLPRDNWPLVGPSALPYTERSQPPRKMERRDMDAVVRDFAEAAGRALDAGVDLLLVHMAHGYLLASFLSPLTNLRLDRYGGRLLENRMRFPLEVFEAVRAAWPDTRPLGAVVQASDWAPGGLELDDAVAVARALAERGCDLVMPLAGQAVPGDRPRFGRAYLAPAADRLRNEAGVPTLCGGAIATTGLANTLVAGARADLCVLDPD